MVIAEPVNTPEAWSARAVSGEQWEACGWSRNGQEARMSAVVRRLGLEQGESLLDFGCGTGRLSEFLPADVSYTGYDFAAGMRDRARLEHPGSEVLDYLPPFRRFDAVVCVGPFNLPGGWSKQHTFHTLRWLWDTTGCRVLAASLYAGDDRNCLRYTIPELLTVGRQLSFHHHAEWVLPNDLLLTARRVRP